jgi:hypothetical protein
MKKISLTLGLMACLIISATAQVTISDVTLPGTLKAGNTNLILNGGGTRVKLFMDIYVAGLYLTAKNTNGDAIAKANEAAAVRLQITSSMATSERMADAVKEGFQKSTGGNTKPIQAKVDRFLKLFSQEPIVKTNIFELVYEPGVGVKVSKNGKLLDTIDGLDFKTALFGIWLGNDPVDKNLKAGMLGVPK